MDPAQWRRGGAISRRTYVRQAEKECGGAADCYLIAGIHVVYRREKTADGKVSRVRASRPACLSGPYKEQFQWIGDVKRRLRCTERKKRKKKLRQMKFFLKILYKGLERSITRT